MSAKKAVIVALISLTVSSLVMFTPLLFDWVNRTQKEQPAKRQLADMRSSLYEPIVVAELTAQENTYPVNYFNDCVGASVELVYGTNHSLTEIIEEYDQALIAGGWELDPGYKISADYVVYRNGPTNRFAISSTPTLDLSGVNEGQYRTIYSVSLSYITPAHNECLG